MNHGARESVEARFEYLTSHTMRSEYELAACDAVAYHGTSIEALLAIVRTGALPGGMIEGKGAADAQKKVLYFFENLRVISDRKDPTRLIEVQEPSYFIHRASHYAQTVESQLSLIRSLGLDPANPDHRRFADHLLDGTEPAKEPEQSEFFDFRDQILEQRGLELSDLKRLSEDASSRRGVVLALAPRLETDFDFKEGDRAADDMYIELPVQGLEMSYISGLWFPNQDEKEEFLKRAYEELDVRE